jgi:chromosome partitioning protein
MRIISIINQKGGCGKTTSAINLAGITARKGFRTLLVDLDPQSHCAAGLAIPEQRIDLDIGDVMLAAPDQAIDPGRLFWRASRNLDLAPSRMKLAGLESSRGGLADKPDKERRLANVLSRFARNYDICFIDCSPSIGLLTFNALAAATDVLIPVETSFFALQGATKQVSTIKSLSKRLGSQAPYWLVATIHDEASVLACDLLDELRRRFLKRVVPQVIRRDPTLKEAASFGQPVVEYAPSSTGARDYTALAEWLIETVSLGHESRPRVPEVVPAESESPSEPPSVEVVGAMEAKLAIGRRIGGMGEETGLQRGGDTTSSPGDTSTTSEYSTSGGSVGADIPLRVDHSDSGRGESESGPSTSTGAVALAPRTDSREVLINFEQEPAEAAAITRAEDMAQRARVMLLKRADERLRTLMGGGSIEAVSSVPVSVIEEVKPAPVLTLESTARSRSDSIRSLFGVRQTRSGILFVQPISSGLRVAVAGDFNGWSSTASIMKRNDELGVFELCTPIRPGRQRYRLVIDGRWAADPFNNNTEPNEFNELNSIVDVEG